jgi:hypothetical protein
MKAYKKNYLGNGQEVVTKAGTALDIVKVCLSVEEMMKFVHEYKDEQYVSFEVARMKTKNDYGDTHTVFHTTFEQVEEEAPTAKFKIKKDRPSKAQIAATLKKAESVKNRQELTDSPASDEILAEKAELSETPQN